MGNELEQKELQWIMEEFKPELILENKIDIATQTFGGDKVVGLTSDNLLNDSRRILLYSSLKHFREDLTKYLKIGDVVGIYEGTRVNNCLGLSSVESSSGALSLFWVKDENVVVSTKTRNVVEQLRSVNNIDEIDIIVTGSSRPSLIPYCIESFKKMLITRKNTRWILHEDFVFPKESEKVIRWAEDSKVFTNIYSHNPAEGLGTALTFLLPRIRSEFAFYLQEDWELERPVDLDQIIWTMQQHSNINVVILNKYTNIGSYAGFPSNEFSYSGLRLCGYDGWSFIPGVWRMETFKRYWKHYDVRPEGKFNNSFRGGSKIKDPNVCAERLGTFFYGCAGDPRYVRHLGNNWRMASWRLEDGKPTGTPYSDNPERNKAPWVPDVERPVYDGRKLE